MMKRLSVLCCAVAALAVAVPLIASAEDALKVAIGQINNWENQGPTLGQDAGIFKKHGLVLENFGTAGAGETLQPIISASADIGAGVGVAGAMRAFARGAPARGRLPALTVTVDVYSYVTADPPVRSLKDATTTKTIPYSSSGSMSTTTATALLTELSTTATPAPTATAPTTLPAVMGSQVTIARA